MGALPDYPQALQLALRDVQPLKRVECLNLSEGANRILAEAIAADRDLPPVHRAQMDGYALRASEFVKGKSWRVAHSIAAGSSPAVRVLSGECVAIATGAALPEDVDTVIQHELSDRGDHHGQPVQFMIDAVQPWNAVHQRGSDAKAGETLLEAGTCLQPHHLGIAAAAGATKLDVVGRPRVAIVTSGDEVVPPETSNELLQPHQIRNSNQLMIKSLVERAGGDPFLLQHVKDDRAQTREALRTAFDNADLVITIGGVSAGDRDYFPEAIPKFGVKTTLQGASIQPGRPIIVGCAPSNVVIVGLPGNPVSALACACLFVWPILRVMLGLNEELPWREVSLMEPVKPNPNRRAYRPASLIAPDRVRVPNWAGSGDLAHTAKTNGLLELPVQSESVPSGARLRFLPWPS